MFARKWIAVLAALGYSMTAHSGNLDGVTITHHETVERLSISAPDSEASRKPTGIGPINVRFDALGRTFDLDLQPNAALLAGFREPGSAVPYRGEIAGVPGSWVRLVIADGQPAGMIWDGRDLIAIERPGDSIVDATTPVAYRLSDVVVAPGALSCAAGTSEMSGSAVYKSVVGDLSAAMAQMDNAISEINIGTVTDADFTNLHAADPQTAIMDRMSNVDGIFSSQLGVQVNVPVFDIFTAADDPFSGAMDFPALLNQLGAYRSSEPSQNAQGLTHLWTGRDLDGSTVGLAYVGVLCSSGAGAGASEGRGGPAFDSLVAAHEIGHNFGARHDGVQGEGCESTPSTFLMATTLNPNNNQFSQCSIDAMTDDIAAASTGPGQCIFPLPATDISIRFNEPSAIELLSNAVRYTVDVVNNGINVAENVVADITLPANVSLIDASGSPAVCTNGAGTVSCQVGDVQGRSAVTIAVNTDTVAVGVGSFNAAVVADADDRPSNNSDAVQLTVDPAVNLVINAPSAPDVIVDQNTDITATLENLSPLDATGVTLSISLAIGLEVNSASWSIGNCNISARQVDCQAAQFDGQSSSTLTVNVKGLTRGSQSFTVSLASNEIDADPADNDVNGSLRVTNAGGNDDDSGGGSLGWLFLFILASTAWLRGARRQSRLNRWPSV